MWSKWIVLAGLCVYLFMSIMKILKGFLDNIDFTWVGVALLVSGILWWIEQKCEDHWKHEFIKVSKKEIKESV